MAGEETVGSIVGFLRLDTTDWMTHIAAAQAAAEELGSVDPDVHVSVNSAGAISELAAIRVATEHTADSMDDLGNRSQSAGQRGSHGMLSILKAVAPILPALVPLAGAAVGVGAAFGGMGAAGALAFLGLKRDMQEGTTDGQKLSAAIDGLKGGVQALETTASSGVLDGLLKGVDSVNQHLPALNAEIGHMATALGGTAYAAVDGILNLLVRLSPVMDMVAGGVEHVADEFDQWTKGAGASDFVSYLVQNLPTAGSLLANLATDVEHLVVAFAPLGSTVLSALSEVAAILKAIPVSVLTVLATGAATAYGAFLLWRGLPVILNGVSGALERVAYRMDSAVALNGAMAVSSGALKGALGGALAALAIGVTVWSLWREHQQKAEEQQRQLTDAIQQDNGAIGENTQKILANKIANDGLLQQSKELGISTSDLNAVLKQQPGALAAIHDQLMKTNSIRKTSNRLANETGNTSKVLDQRAAQYYGTLKQLHDQIGKGVSKSKAYKAALAAQEGATSKAAAATTAAALASMSATEADKDQKTAIDKLNQSITTEIGKQLALSGSITAYDSARNQLIKTLKKSTSTTNGNTDAGIKNRQAIENTVSALQRHRQVAIQNGASTDEATAKYQKQAAQLLTQVKRTDGASSSTYKYTKRLLDVPDDVKTKIDLPGYETAMTQARKYHIRLDDLPPSVRTLIIAETHGAEAALRRTLSLIAGLHNKTIQIDTHYTYSGTPPHGGPGTHIHPGAWANGGVVGHAYANGGVAVKSYASGGMENHIAQIATSGPRLWAEPETGGEAYIPLSPAKRPRSMRILDDVAGRFGQQLVPVAGGGSRVGLGSTAVTVMIPDSQMERFAEVVGLSVGQAAYAGTAQRQADVAMSERMYARSRPGGGD